MSFLKKIFKRSSDEDDEDDDDFDFSNIEEDGENGESSTTVILDDDDGLDEDDEDEEGDSIRDAQLAALEEQMAQDDDSLFGTGGQLDGGDDDDDDMPAPGQDEYDVEVDDDEEADDEEDGWDDGDDDDDDWDDDEDGPRRGAGGKRKRLIFIAAGATVLILGIAGGAAFWLMGEDEQVAAPAREDGRVQMAIPPKSGSLNALGTDEGEAPADGEGIGEGAGADAEQVAEAGDEGEQQAEALDGESGDGQSTNLLASPQGGDESGSLNALAGATSGAQGLILPAVTAASYGRVANLPKGVPLARAPDKALLEQVEGVPKPLPKIDDRGRKPWEVYARPLTGNEVGQPVALIVTGLGLSRAATMAAIRKLPPEVGLVFEPYAADLDDWLLRARLAGHEVYLSLPMESGKFPNQDAGPLALTTSVQVADNLARLRMVLGSFGGYVGVVSKMGSKFSTADGQLKPILAEIKRRGLMFVDAAEGGRSSAPTIAAEIDLPVVKNNVVIDSPPASGDIQRRLRRLESFVSRNATAIALIRPYPVSIHQVQAWTKTLAEKKLTLVPVSSLVGKQFIE